MFKKIILGIVFSFILVSPVFAQTITAEQIIQALLQNPMLLTQVRARLAGVAVKDNHQQSIKVISPKENEWWWIGRPHSIKLSSSINVDFPLTSQIEIVLSPEAAENQGGIIDCIKKASDQSEFIWRSGNVLMEYCGAGSINKYKNVLPGKYKIKFISDNPSQTILAESNPFWIFGYPIPVGPNDFIKPLP